ncbi:uncharacterized protein LOC129767264 [Toxorhynchites rutilus septentrionalis]|uniref:uncharacterized protein LOC129767264 n=1 Tax=Toxorhynchites rutilus septentrionalis TaxID=329112 RepID=UPI0024795794|nr:uncharacterized protein LOC129767264 [Toxorhynchites rutilus septentrionalis]
MTMFFQKCCRLCLDETKTRMEIQTVDSLPEMLERLYGLKFDSDDKCSRSICTDCCDETKETHKWLKFYEEQKQAIAANQQRFQEELVQQLGPEEAASSPVPTKVTPTSRAERVSRRSANKSTEPERPVSVSVKKERIVTRSKKEQDWEPPSSSSGKRYSETPSYSPSEDNDDDEDDETISSETATSTTDSEFKCPKCEVVFDDMGALEKHTCQFVCSICSAEMSYRNSLRRHLTVIHKISAKNWQNYWNPRSDWEGAQSLLVETTKPKKRYRYESDSPTDIEEDSDQVENEKREISCNHCSEKFDSTIELKAHDCDYACNICGSKFANRTNVRRHKINVHKMDPNDVSLRPVPRTPSRAAPQSASRPASRPVSRAASMAPSENPSEDEPLAALAAKDGESAEGYVLGKDKYRFFCTHCDYTNKRKVRLIKHIVNVHNVPKDQIDVENVRKETLTDSERSKTPINLHRFRSASVPRKTPDRCKTPSVPSQHRSRARSTYLDDLDYNNKRKRSLSACSNKSSKVARSRSAAPSEGGVAIRRIPSDLLTQVSAKLRPTVTGIQSNRLHVAILPGCEMMPPDQPIHIRATSFIPPESSTTKKLFKLRAPVRNERQQIERLRDIFRRPFGRKPGASIAGVKPLVEDAVHPAPVPQLTLESVQPVPVQTAPLTRELFRPPNSADPAEYEIIVMAEPESVTSVPMVTATEPPDNLPAAEPMEVDDPLTTRKWTGPRRKITQRRKVLPPVSDSLEVDTKVPLAEAIEMSVPEIEESGSASNLKPEIEESDSAPNPKPEIVECGSVASNPANDSNESAELVESVEQGETEPVQETNEQNGQNEQNEQVEQNEQYEHNGQNEQNEQKETGDENNVDSMSTEQSKEEGTQSAEENEDFEEVVVEVAPSSSEGENEEQDDDMMILPD